MAIVCNHSCSYCFQTRADDVPGNVFVCQLFNVVIFLACTNIALTAGFTRSLDFLKLCLSLSAWKIVGMFMKLQNLSQYQCLQREQISAFVGTATFGSIFSGGVPSVRTFQAKGAEFLLYYK